MGKAKAYSVLFLLTALCIAVLISCGEDPAEKKEAGTAPQPKWDVTRLAPQTEGLSDEEQADRMEMFGQLFRSIYFDDSEAAERVIGVIDGKDITAKELELRALKMREGGEACPYKAAWEAMCQEAAELRYIKAQNRYDDFSDISRQAFLDMKDAYAEDEVFRRYCDEQKSLFGLSDQEYWSFMEEANQRIQFHLLAEQNIKEHNDPELNPESIKCSLDDQEYKAKAADN